MSTFPGSDFEKKAFDDGIGIVAGVDEVGRGCLAGPVVAAAVVLDLSKPIPKGLNDSKKLSKKARERIESELRESAASISIGRVEAPEIDRINILEATRLAMQTAIEGLDQRPGLILIDSVSLPKVSIPQKSIIKGDAVSVSIAAASVVAKVFRDRLMEEYETVFPGYGFGKNAGYGTAAHFEALRSLGHTPIHRLSFKGVAQDR